MRWSKLRRAGVRGRIGVRARLLAIVLISSVTLLGIGVGAAAYLVKSGHEAKQWAELASSTTTPAMLMVQAFEEERRLSLLSLAGDASVAEALAAARKKSDDALVAVTAKGDAARELNPGGAKSDIEGYNKLFAMVPQVRGGVDARQAPPEQVFDFYTQVIGTIIAASMLAARVAPDAGIAVELGYGVDPLRAAEALSIADSLGAVALTVGELTPAQLTRIAARVGEFRGEVAYAQAVLKGERLARLQDIIASPDYRNVLAQQDAILQRGPVSAARSAELPMSTAAWQDASGRLVADLLRLWEDQSRDAHALARQQGEHTERRSLLGGAAVLAIAALAFVLALVLANRFIGRMRRLRRDTLELADERLPELMRRLDAGEPVDAAAEGARLDYGTDELGQVAKAFNRAQVAALSAAVAEANTRTGVNAVFLNIAHRSQVVVHRQLALLDQAERREENADQLELLFQLDHLATRARRNAENLIILGGEQPGRRWRKPVQLLELVRGAVAESLDYTRIHTGRMPEVAVISSAVADLIHLLAELMDNATAFSPPQARVNVTGAVVGRGVAIEIVDQGLGMSDVELAERNRLLADPPDFHVAALSSDTRLGLFVVAKLATRHGVSVRLGESVYGGVRAVVVIPTALLAAEDVAETAVAQPEPVARRSAWFTPAAELAAKPPLPRRARQHATRTDTAPPEVAPARPRTADQARTLMSAIESGTREGRRPRAEFDSTAIRNDEIRTREGDDDHFPAN
ncbi:nitrate- and nitrite sensing domain-containing protein [Nocardia sp. CDC159]|uniref:histidine kinase n=1 Tax=Nocardia pulmonis TaxID=2951408 RepID=A0A9X2E7T1_9NOCA|nr:MULTISPECIES: nitrate- and nitrite sensing domain-containing protein [Nocardia]MCM6775887.1 nitrate- and nitrite sensing domain-containing protein [Nocardia pulmonis]MCM6788137.1 nitrate- and nitrite sensing domain-containing protein [Nocardia sp. CDC159]